VPEAQAVAPQGAIVLQVVAQQNPPRQRLLVQALFVEHAAPPLPGTHAPPLQRKPTSHWALEVHVVPQVLAFRHAKLPGHGIVADPIMQFPLPLHWSGNVSVPPEHMDCPMHPVVPAGHISHWPVFVHLPSVPHDACAVVAHVPLGSTVPALTLAQAPSRLPVSAAVHAWHCPLHGKLQQTPPALAGAHWPLVHWSLPVQGAPFACFGTHWLEPLQ
jgi:hypothetical protein